MVLEKMFVYCVSYIVSVYATRYELRIYTYAKKIAKRARDFDDGCSSRIVGLVSSPIFLIYCIQLCVPQYLCVRIESVWVVRVCFSDHIQACARAYNNISIKTPTMSLMCMNAKKIHWKKSEEAIHFVGILYVAWRCYCRCRHCTKKTRQ